MLLLLIFPFLLNSQTDQVLDTISFDEVEWIENYTARKKGVEEAFTGVVTFAGELDYRRGISWRLLNNGYFSAANFICTHVYKAYGVIHTHRKGVFSRKKYQNNSQIDIFCQ